MEVIERLILLIQKASENHGICFITKPEGENLTIDHIDRNKLNNYINNLRWSSKSDQAYNRKRPKLKCRIIVQYDHMSNFLREWDSAETASTALNISKSAIRHCCNDNQPLSGGFIWKYKKEQFDCIKPINLPDYPEIHAIRSR